MNDKNKNKIWLEEYKLGEWLKIIFPDNIFVRDKFLPFSKKFKPDFYCFELNMIIEFNGYRHYVDFNNCLRDLELQKFCSEHKIQLFDVPYFIQISSELKNILKNNYVEEIIQNYKHGFIDPKATLPCCFCDLGIKRFIKEMNFYKTNYTKIYDDIILSLKNKLQEKKEIYKVVPESLEYLMG